MPFNRGRFRRKNKKRRVAVFFFFVFAVVIILYIMFNALLMPILKTAAVYKAKIVAIYTINSAVGKVLKTDNISYDKLMNFDKDSNGDITAVNADTMQINLLKYDITNEVIKELSSIKSSELKIPFGTVFGGQILTGRGPMINIRIQPMGNVDSNISNTFTSAGINQTRQQVMLDIKADIIVMISSYNVSTQVETNFCIADSVIVGSVPGSYMVINGTSDATDKLFIYGNSGTSGSSSSSSSPGGT
jgi:sporulation protein YunB